MKPNEPNKLIWAVFVVVELILRKSRCNAVMVTSSRTKHSLMGKSRELLFTMATGTPRTVSHGSTQSVTLFLLLYISCVWCQQFVFPFKAPSDCSAEEFFDISSLSCVRCGADQRQSTTGQCMQGTMARFGISAYSTDSQLIVSGFF